MNCLGPQSGWSLQLVLILLVVAIANAFVPKNPCSVAKHATDPTLHRRQSMMLMRVDASPASRLIDFKGTATSKIYVPQQEFSTSQGVSVAKSSGTNLLTETCTMLDFFHSGDSTGALLGTENYAERDDGCFDCRQPSIGWFGMQLEPVFVYYMERSRDDASLKVETKIVDSRYTIGSSAPSVVSRLMQKLNFEGSGKFVCEEDTEGWHVSFDLTVTLQISLPQRAPLPPGFNSIGSRIVSKTCSTRAQQTLNGIKDAYEVWACERIGESGLDMEVATAVSPPSAETDENNKPNGTDDSHDLEHKDNDDTSLRGKPSWRKRFVHRLGFLRRRSRQ